MKVKNLKIKVDKVMTVYSGQLGCMCGCRGIYRVHPAHLDTSNKVQGYDHAPNEINLNFVRRVCRILEAQPEVTVDKEYVYAEVDGRAYCAYFVPERG